MTAAPDPAAGPAVEPILRTEGLTRHYGGVRALTEVDFQVQPGKLHAVIGPNGAGKSTLFNVITGRVPASVGRIWYRGKEITRLSQPAIARYERERAMPDLPTLHRIVEACGFEMRLELADKDRQTEAAARIALERTPEERLRANTRQMELVRALRHG